jgi:membrane-anchored glycerophosphoryl diester phosphodiesterase (GDPDase)
MLQLFYKKTIWRKNMKTLVKFYLTLVAGFMLSLTFSSTVNADTVVTDKNGETIIVIEEPLEEFIVKG